MLARVSLVALVSRRTFPVVVRRYSENERLHEEIRTIREELGEIKIQQKLVMEQLSEESYTRKSQWLLVLSMLSFVVAIILHEKNEQKRYLTSMLRKRKRMEE